MSIDLHALLTPIVASVARLVFPDRVSIEEPVNDQDATGDVLRGWNLLAEHVPALIAPVRSTSQGPGSVVPIADDDVWITLAGDRDIRQSYRIRVEADPAGDFGDPVPRQGDRWDVASVTRDEARVTTTILGRRVRPGTPDEGI